MCSFRYALGRSTSIVSTIVDYIIEDWDKLEVAYQEQMKLEINEAFEFLSEILEAYSSPISTEEDFEQYSSRHTTKHKYQNQSFEPGFPDPFVFEIFLKSSHIISAGYNRTTKILYVKFKPNSVYKYHDFPEPAFKEFINASSHGKYLNKNIAYKFKYECCSEPNQPYRGHTFLPE